MAWTWKLEGEDAAASDGAVPFATLENPSHPSQSDAESWVGEVWPELAEHGVSQVTLFNDGAFVYGPMLLSQ